MRIGIGIGLRGGRQALKPYTPAQEPGILLWIRADLGASDQSGNAGNTVTLVGSPSVVAGVNTQSAWRLQASGPSYLKGTFGTAYTGSTLLWLVVAKFTYSSGNNIAFNAWSSSAASSSTDPGSFVNYQNSSTVAAGQRNGPTSTAALFNDASAQSAIYSSRFTGTQNFARVNGVDAGATASSGAFSLSNFAMNNFWTGSAFSGSGYASMDLSEVIVTSAGAITANLAKYLSNRYGLTA